MSNERLRAALVKSGMTMLELSETVTVDVKTVERWITTGRTPHARTRQAVCATLGADETHLWPDAFSEARSVAATKAELVAFHLNRNAIPASRWLDLARTAERNIDILAFAASFLHDSLDGFFDIVADRAREGVKVRLLFGDPDSAAAKLRGEEEGIGDGLAHRCALTWTYLAPYLEIPNIEARKHGSTLYNSIYRFDDVMMVNTHALGAPASRSPMLEFHNLPGGRVYSHYASSLAFAWERATHLNKVGD